MCECDGLLEKFGGHRYAAGVTVRTERIPELAGRLSEIASREMGEDGFRPRLKIDGPLSADEISMNFAEEIERFAPFGVGNPEPVLVLRNAVVLSTSVLKEEAREVLGRGGIAPAGRNRLEVRTSGGGTGPGARVDLAFTCGINEWNGSRSVQLELKDVKSRGVGNKD